LLRHSACFPSFVQFPFARCSDPDGGRASSSPSFACREALLCFCRLTASCLQVLRSPRPSVPACSSASAAHRRAFVRYCCAVAIYCFWGAREVRIESIWVAFKGMHSQLFPLFRFALRSLIDPRFAVRMDCFLPLRTRRHVGPAERAVYKWFLPFVWWTSGRRRGIAKALLRSRPFSQICNPS